MKTATRTRDFTIHRANLPFLTRAERAHVASLAKQSSCQAQAATVDAFPASVISIRTQSAGGWA